MKNLAKNTFAYLGAGVLALGMPLAYADPATINGLAAWYDAADINGNGSTYTDGTGVTNWVDKSGNDNHIPAVVSPPTFESAGLDGFAAVYFNGFNWMQRGSFVQGPLDGSPNANTIFTVFKTNTNSNDNSYVYDGLNGARNMLIIRSVANEGTLQPYCCSEFGSGFNNGSYISMVEHHWSDAAVVITVNNMPVPVHSQNDFSHLEDRDPYEVMGGITLGARYNGAQKFTGHIAEIVVFDRPLTESERVDMHVYLEAKWGFPSTINEPPTAVAGADQAIRAGDTVNLDGSASFDDNTAQPALVYAWIFSSKPVGSLAALTDATTATPSFVADIAGTYVVGLTVADEGELDSAPDEVEISSDNLAPTAVAGEDQLVIIGGSVVLDGTGSSDPEMDALTFDWMLTPDQPTGSTATLSDAASASPNFVPDLEGLYTVTLEVSDFLGAGMPDTVEITVTTAAGFAEVQIVAVDGIVSALSAGEVTTAGNQNAFTNFLSQAILALQDGDTDKAIDKLEKSIKRTDGCVLRGQVDGNGSGKDWITDCAAQADIYALLNDALSALTP